MSNLTDKSRGVSCIRCGAPHAYSCHYNGIRQHFYGKGRSIKCSDIATAELCHKCDLIYGEGTTEPWENEVDRSEEFLHLIMRTNIRRHDTGVLNDDKRKRA